MLAAATSLSYMMNMHLGSSQSWLFTAFHLCRCDGTSLIFFFCLFREYSNLTHFLDETLHDSETVLVSAPHVRTIVGNIPRGKCTHRSSGTEDYFQGA